MSKKRKSNKQVKAMIERLFEQKKNQSNSIICFFWSGGKLMVQYYDGWGPDNYCIDEEPYISGVVSMPATQAP